MALGPNDRGKGWQIGSDAAKVDIPFASQQIQDEIEPIHCSLKLDRSTSAIMIIPMHSTIVDGKRELRGPTEQQVLLAETGLGIGPLHYVYRSTDLSPITLSRQIEGYRKKLGWGSCETPSGYLSPPTIDAKCWQDFIVESPIYGGTFGRICCGRHNQTGVLVAVKYIIARSEKTLESIRREVEILRSLNHVRTTKRLLRSLSQADLYDSRTRCGSRRATSQILLSTRTCHRLHEWSRRSLS